MKKIFKVLSIFFLLNIFIENVYTQCNDLGAFLNNGWNIDPETLRDVDYGGNWDDFAVADPSPFLLKVGLYPPVKVFKHENTNVGQCITLHLTRIMKILRFLTISEKVNYTSAKKMLLVK